MANLNEELAEEVQDGEGENNAGIAASPKHELQHAWGFWVQMPRNSQKQGSWQEQQRLIHEFGTAEDFWQMHHHIHAPSRLENADYGLFKKGVTPAWEDPAFESGGRWVVKLEKVKAQSLDDLWLSLCLALIGEAFVDYGGETVCGGIVSVRSRASKVALWLSVAKEEKRVMAIGHAYRDVLASTPGLADLANKDITFEDFRKQTVTYSLKPQSNGATVGVYQ